MLANVRKNYIRRLEGNFHPLYQNDDFPDLCREMVDSSERVHTKGKREGEREDLFSIPGKCPTGIAHAGRRCHTSQFGQDKFLYDNFFYDGYLRNKGFFVEVGGYDPIFFSNTYFLDVCLGWDGIVIEPSPTNYEKFDDTKYVLKLKRSGKIIHSCVWDSKTTLRLKEHSFYSELVLNEEDEKKHREKEIVEVPCDRLETILDAHGVTKIDFMSMDIEGSEEVVINDFDFRKYDVDMLCVEKNQAFRNKNYNLTRTLLDKGMMLMQVMAVDYWFMRQPNFKLPPQHLIDHRRDEIKC